MQPNQEPLIQLEGVTKVFYTDEVETHALAGVHLQIFPGEYVSIAGPSGCGKSTLLAILGLLDSPTQGKYLLKGRNVESLKAAERARTGKLTLEHYNLGDKRPAMRRTDEELKHKLRNELAMKWQPRGEMA